MTVDLRTTYLGLELKNPLVAAASPLTGHLESLCQMEEAGAAAVVMPSLFEEQLERDELAVRRYFELGRVSSRRPLSENARAGPSTTRAPQSTSRRSGEPRRQSRSR